MKIKFTSSIDYTLSDVCTLHCAQYVRSSVLPKGSSHTNFYKVQDSRVYLLIHFANSLTTRAITTDHYEVALRRGTDYTYGAPIRLLPSTHDEKTNMPTARRLPPLWQTLLLTHQYHYDSRSVGKKVNYYFNLSHYFFDQLMYVVYRQVHSGGKQCIIRTIAVK